jgi:hypothetical protein
MFLATFFCVLFQKFVFRQGVRWNGAGWIIQHVPPFIPGDVLIIALAIDVSDGDDWLVILPGMGMASDGVYCPPLCGIIDETTFLCILHWVVIK